VSFFQALQAALNKQTTGSRKTPEELDAAVRQLVSKALVTEGQVIDVFTAAGLPKPDLSILDDRFQAEVRGLKHKHVAAELLEKLLKDELKVRSKRNLVLAQRFSERLKQTLNAYHNRAIATQEVIEELIKLAKELNAATKAGQEMGLPVTARRGVGGWISCYWIRTSSGVSVAASIARIVSRTHLAFLSISSLGKSFSSFSK
jgi:type I restriction enzyme R subunit